MEHAFEKKNVKVGKINVTYNFFWNKSLSRRFVVNCNMHSTNTG